MFPKTAEPIQFTKTIQNIVVSEYQSATFECEVSFDDAVVTWYKGKVELRESQKYSFRSEGRCHYMTIHNVTADDEGNVTLFASFPCCHPPLLTKIMSHNKLPL